MTQPPEGSGPIPPPASEPPPPLPPAAPLAEAPEAATPRAGFASSSEAPSGPLPAPPPPVPRSLLPPDQLPYPVRYEVAYPEGLSRWKTLLRLPLLVPVYLFLYLVQAALFPVFAIGWTTVFWRKKYPSWAFDGGAGAMGFAARAGAYALLQTDKFPSFDYERPDVVLEFAQPPSGQLSRWRVFWWKLALLLPHYAALYFLQAALSVVTVLAWFGILFSGNYPRGMFAFATGVMRWHYRVLAYFVSYNDRYPPFALSRDAAPAGAKAVIWSGVGGVALFGGFTALIVLGAATAGDGGRHTAVRYADLRSGRGGEGLSFAQPGGPVVITLNRVTDPGDSLVPILKPARDEKVVVFQWTVRNRSNGDRRIPGGDAATLEYTDGETHHIGAEFITVDGRVAPGLISPGAAGVVQGVFVLPKTAAPLELTFAAGWASRGGIVYRFIP